jgi:hypothetical protein
LFTESLILYRELENKGSIATALAGLAGVVGARGQAERAATLFGAVEALVETTGTSFEVTDRVEYERNVATTCVQLDEEIFAAAWAEGRTMTIEQAITYALGSEQ